jgi:hypothetical protein
LYEKADRPTAVRFLEALIAAVPYRLHTVLTDNVLSWDARALSKQQVSCAGALPVVGCVLSKWLPPAKGCSLP